MRTSLTNRTESRRKVMVSRVNKVGGQQTRGRGPKGSPPPSVCSTGCRAESGGGQDLPDRAADTAVVIEDAETLVMIEIEFA